MSLEVYARDLCPKEYICQGVHVLRDISLGVHILRGIYARGSMS